MENIKKDELREEIREEEEHKYKNVNNIFLFLIRFPFYFQKQFLSSAFLFCFVFLYNFDICFKVYSQKNLRQRYNNYPMELIISEAQKRDTTRNINHNTINTINTMIFIDLIMKHIIYNHIQYKRI